MKWFKMYFEFATDPKVQMMPEHMQRRLIMLFCLCCNETLETLHETEIAFALRISPEELAETKELFLQNKFIDETWNVTQWQEKQKSPNSSTERVRRYREKQKQQDETPDVTHETLHETNCNSLDKTRPDSDQTQTREEKKILKDLYPTDSQYAKSQPLQNVDPPNGSFTKINGLGSGSRWNVLEHLSVEGDAAARDSAKFTNRDFDDLVRKYNSWVSHNPPKNADKGFNAWILKYTKGEWKRN